jgi:hypothetical protein
MPDPRDTPQGAGFQRPAPRKLTPAERAALFDPKANALAAIAYMRRRYGTRPQHWPTPLADALPRASLPDPEVVPPTPPERPTTRPRAAAQDRPTLPAHEGADAPGCPRCGSPEPNQACPYCGVFPCEPYSVAGRRRA